MSINIHVRATLREPVAKLLAVKVHILVSIKVESQIQVLCPRLSAHLLKGLGLSKRCGAEG